MEHEELLEDGIVIESENGQAEISLIKTDNCEECHAKLFCKPKSDNTKILRVSDPFGVKPGDEVKISVAGSTIFKVSMILYGIPLFLLIAGVFLALEIFPQNHFLELYSFLTGLSFAGIYYLIIFLFSESFSKTRFMPRITYVKRKLA